MSRLQILHYEDKIHREGTLTMPIATIQDPVHGPAMSPTSGAHEGDDKKDGNWNWNPWRIGPIFGTDKPSLPAEGQSSSGVLARSVLTWDVKMPPTKKHMVGGHLVPTVRGKVQFMSQKTRRISIEIHGSHLDKPDESSVKQTTMQGLFQSETHDSAIDKEFLQDNEAVFFRVLKEAKGSRHHSHGHDDSSSTGSSAQGDHAGTYTIIELSSGDSTRLRASKEISKQRY
jgi:hypothetical protein